MYAVETRDLNKWYKTVKAVKGLNLKIPEGSVYGFLGPNGAGKTTTIKMLTGLSKPTSGRIFINSTEVKFGNKNNFQHIGYLPDVPQFYTWMTPEQLLTFCGELFSIDKSILKNRVGELMHLVGLEGVNKRIGGFSRGMKQRLGIAQALINDPKVVFLDEPTSALDPIGRKEITDTIVKLAGKVTVFLSTHILSDVERMCDRVLIINNGKAIMEDSIQNLRKKYPTRTILLELENQRDAKIILNTFKQQKWQENVSINESGEIRLSVNIISEAQHSIPKILSERELPLKKFLILEPSLEDIFLKVVNQ